MPLRGHGPNKTIPSLSGFKRHRPTHGTSSSSTSINFFKDKDGVVPIYGLCSIAKIAGNDKRMVSLSRNVRVALMWTVEFIIGRGHVFEAGIDFALGFCF